MEENNLKEEFDKKKYNLILISIGLFLVATIIVISLLRERLVSPGQNQITVYGEGKVGYAPDTATVTLGVRVDKAPTAEEALSQLNEKMKKITDAVLALGIAEEDIKTENYNLTPAYDYRNGVSAVSGYNAFENVSIKIKGADKDPDTANRVVGAAANAGTNEVQGINYYVENPNELRQKARIAAIQDARSKAADLAKAAGIRKLGKVVSWYEEPAAGVDDAYSQLSSPRGMGGVEMKVSEPQFFSGTREITVNVGVNFEVK